MERNSRFVASHCPRQYVGPIVDAVVDQQELSGRRVIVTGSSSGIGAATARRVVALGGTVVVNSVTSVDAGRALAEQLGGESFYVQADISVQEDRARLIDAAVDRLGGIDVLVNNAGWTTTVDHSNLEELTADIFRRTFEVNVFGTWELTKLAIPHLRNAVDPSVVVVTSVAGIRPVGSSIAYSMSKAALNHMVLLLAKSFGPIRVNGVAPGLVSTPWTEDWTDLHEAVRRKAPLGRSATPDDVAEAVLALIRTRYATGEILVVDGGFSQVV